MGYCMNLVEADFHIAKDQFEPAKLALQGLGAHGWVQADDLVRAETLTEALKAWRWYPDFDEKGDIVDLTFCGEKLGDDYILFLAIAPFVKDGSFVQMAGEDGDMWRWTFKNGTCVEIVPDIKWGD
jgi:hypothetical protein